MRSKRADYDAAGMLTISLEPRQIAMLAAGNGIELPQPTGDTILITPAGGRAELGAGDALERIYRVAEDGLELETLDALLKRSGFRTAAGLIDPTGQARAELDRIEELADEFEENGLSYLAEHLRGQGVAETLEWLEREELPRARLEDQELHQGEGFELGNLETAEERLRFTLEERGR